MTVKVKNGRKIIGKVFTASGQFYYAFGNSSNSIGFTCDSLEDGIEKIKKLS